MPNVHRILNLPGFTIKNVSGFKPLLLDVKYTCISRCGRCSSKKVRIKDSFIRIVKHETIGCRFRSEVRALDWCYQFCPLLSIYSQHSVFYPHGDYFFNLLRMSVSIVLDYIITLFIIDKKIRGLSSWIRHIYRDANASCIFNFFIFRRLNNEG